MGRKHHKKSSKKTKASSTVASVQTASSLPVDVVESEEILHASEAPFVNPLLSSSSVRNPIRNPPNPEYPDVYDPDCPYLGLTLFDPEYIPPGYSTADEIRAGKWALEHIRKRVFCIGIVRHGRNDYRFETVTKTKNQLYSLSIQTLAPTDGEIILHLPVNQKTGRPLRLFPPSNPLYGRAIDSPEGPPIPPSTDPSTIQAAVREAIRRSLGRAVESRAIVNVRQVPVAQEDLVDLDANPEDSDWSDLDEEKTDSASEPEVRILTPTAPPEEGAAAPEPEVLTSIIIKVSAPSE